MHESTSPPAADLSRSTFRRRRLLLVLAGTAAALMIGFGAIAVSRFFDGRHELADAIAESDRLDPGWRLEELEAQRQIPPVSQNAALQVFTVQASLPPGWHIPPAGSKVEETKYADEVLRDLSPERRLDDNLVRWLREDLKRAGQAIDQARKLADMPKGRYPVTWSGDVISTSCPWYDAIHSAGGLLRLDALRHIQDGDQDAALNSARALLNVGRSLGDEPFLYGPTNRNWCRFQTAHTVERTLAQGRASEKALAAMQELVATEEAVPILLAHFRGQRAFMHVFLTRVDQGQNRISELNCVPTRGLGAHAETWLGRTGALHKHAQFLRGMNEAVEIAKMPLEQQAPRYRRWREQKGSVDNVGDGLRLAGWKEDGLLATHGLLRCTAVALAAERYRRKHGDWPQALTDLVPSYLHEVPLDPFYAAPLRYRRTDGGAVIYSVGKDGHDDGGDARPSPDDHSPRDIVFTLWDVDHRGQAPRMP